MTDKRTIFRLKKQRKAQLTGAFSTLAVIAAIGLITLTSDHPSSLNMNSVKQAAFMAESERCTRYISAIEAKYNIPENLLLSISTIESGRWNRATLTSVTWPWTLNVEGKPYRYNSKEETLAALEDFRAKGKKLIDVGCMQVNMHFHPDAFPNDVTALEPRYNIEYAAQLLTSHYQKTKNWKRAIAHYHSATPKFGSRYLKKVVAKWNQINRSLASNSDQTVPVPVTKLTMRSQHDKDIDG